MIYLQLKKKKNGSYVENGGHLLVPADPIRILILDSFSQINLEIHQIHTKEDLMGHRI